MIERPDAYWFREWHKRTRLGRLQMVAIIVGLPLFLLFFRPNGAALAICLILSFMGAWSGFTEARSGRLDVILPVPDKSPSSFSRLVPILTIIAAVISALLDRAWIEAVGYVLFFWAGVLLGIVAANLTARK